MTDQTPPDGLLSPIAEEPVFPPVKIIVPETAASFSSAAEYDGYTVAPSAIVMTPPGFEDLFKEIKEGFVQAAKEIDYAKKPTHDFYVSPDLDVAPCVATIEIAPLLIEKAYLVHGELLPQEFSLKVPAEAMKATIDLEGFAESLAHKIMLNVAKDLAKQLALHLKAVID